MLDAQIGPCTGQGHGYEEPKRNDSEHRTEGNGSRRAGSKEEEVHEVEEREQGGWQKRGA
jgi:hypothetical protein